MKPKCYFSQTHFKQGYLIILLLPYRLKNTSIPDTEDTLIWIYNIFFYQPNMLEVHTHKFK